MNKITKTYKYWHVLFPYLLFIQSYTSPTDNFYFEFIVFLLFFFTLYLFVSNNRKS